jgi:ribulose-5-phosphate 4-epimerase/fuculose-1-phosphate aldolase
MILLSLSTGAVLSPPPQPPHQILPANAAGYLIHAPIHRSRPDVHAICHAHTTHGKAWSVFGKPLEMLTQDACKFYNSHVVYNAYGGVVLAEEEGENIARCLGGTEEGNKAAILRNHGLLTVGGTVDEAAFLFLSLEKACEGQLLVEMAENKDRGVERVLISDEEAEYNFRMESDAETGYVEFQAYYELEEHLDPSFKN